MLEFLRARLTQGTRTSPFPEGGAELPERFRGRPTFDRARCDGTCRGCLHGGPSALMGRAADGSVQLDVGASLFAPEEAVACDNGALAFTQDYRLASRSRSGLVSPDGEIELARAVYHRNDERAALKRQINDRLGSRLVEEKSYNAY